MQMFRKGIGMVHKKIVVAGHICVDLTPVFPPGEKSSVREALVPGRLLHMEGMDIHTGGAVSNTGLALKKLGAAVELMGKVGKDELGRLVLEIMKSHGVEKGIVEMPDVPPLTQLPWLFRGWTGSFFTIREPMTRTPGRISGRKG